MEMMKASKVRRNPFLPALIDVDDENVLVLSFLFLGKIREIGPTWSGSEGSCHEES